MEGKDHSYTSGSSKSTGSAGSSGSASGTGNSGPSPGTSSAIVAVGTPPNPIQSSNTSSNASGSVSVMLSPVVKTEKPFLLTSGVSPPCPKRRK